MQRRYANEKYNRDTRHYCNDSRANWLGVPIRHGSLMLRLLQVIQYMLVNLEYSETEVVEHLKAVQYGRLTFPDLLDVLGLESEGYTLDQLAESKIKSGRWYSALNVVKMKIGA